MTKRLRNLINELLFVLSVNAHDFRVLQRFLAQLKDGHLLQIFPIHTNLRSRLLQSGVGGGILITDKTGTVSNFCCSKNVQLAFEANRADDVVERSLILKEVVFGRDTDEIIHSPTRSDHSHNPVGFAATGRGIVG